MKESKLLGRRLALVNEIYRLAMEINVQGQYLCFFDISPHVKWIGVSIRPFDDYKEILYKNYSIYYDGVSTEHEDMMKTLRVVIKKLKKYAEVKENEKEN